MRELLERSAERHKRAQLYLKKNQEISLVALAKAMKSNPSTLKQDQNRFGQFRYLKPNIFSLELRAKRIQTIRQAFINTPNASGRKLEELTQINRKMIYKLIKEEGLKI